MTCREVIREWCEAQSCANCERMFGGEGKTPCITKLDNGVSTIVNIKAVQQAKAILYPA